MPPARAPSASRPLTLSAFSPAATGRKAPKRIPSHPRHQIRNGNAELGDEVGDVFVSPFYEELDPTVDHQSDSERQP